MNELGEASSPFEEGVALLSLEIRNRHVARPRWSARHLQALDILPLLFPNLGLLLRSQEVGIVGGGGQIRVGNDFDVLALCTRWTGLSETAADRYVAHALTCGEVGLGQLRGTEELVQVVFLGDGRQARANLGRVLRRQVSISAMRSSWRTVQTHKRRVGSFFRRLDFAVDDSSTESRLVDPALLRAVRALRTSVGLRATTTTSVTGSAQRADQEHIPFWRMRLC